VRQKNSATRAHAPRAAFLAAMMILCLLLFATSSHLSAQQVRLTARQGWAGTDKLPHPAGLAGGVEFTTHRLGVEAGYSFATAARSETRYTCVRVVNFACEESVQEIMDLRAWVHALEGALLFYPLKSARIRVGAGAGVSLDLFGERGRGRTTAQQSVANATPGISARVIMEAAAKLSPRLSTDLSVESRRGTAACATDLYEAQCGSTRLTEIRLGLSFALRQPN
jgi:hypothetical protein